MLGGVLFLPRLLISLSDPLTLQSFPCTHRRLRMTGFSYNLCSPTSTQTTCPSTSASGPRNSGEKCSWGLTGHSCLCMKFARLYNLIFAPWPPCFIRILAIVGKCYRCLILTYSNSTVFNNVCGKFDILATRT